MCIRMSPCAFARVRGSNTFFKSILTCQVQLLVDVARPLSKKKQTTGIVKVVAHDGKGLNNPLALIIVLLYEGGDDHSGLAKNGEKVRQQLLEMETQGLTLEDGVEVKIKMLLGGDMLMLNNEMGCAWCSAEKPCVWCLINIFDDPQCLREYDNRDVKESAKCSHAVIPGFQEP